MFSFIKLVNLFVSIFQPYLKPRTFNISKQISLIQEMKLFFTYIYLVALAKNLIVGQSLKGNIVVCNEKFTEKTNKNYTDYPGCLIEKNNTAKTPRQ